jgi:predicted NBD/HSP70 family sugar kinase
MYSGADFYSLAENSHKQVLNVIRIYREISGAEIARITGFQPSTILYILRILDRKGFIRISRTGDSTRKGGKKPVLWQIKPGIGLMLGIEVFKNKLRYVKHDFAGNQYSKGEKVFDVALDKTNALEVLIGLIKEIMDDEDLNHQSFLGVGIGMPGLVDSKQGILQYSSLLQVKDLEIGEKLQQKLKKPVFVVNDANAGALSISWYHHDLDKQLPEHIVYLTYNQGSKNLGAGLIINHELYEGLSGTAGEIFTPLPDQGILLKEAIRKYGREHPLMLENQYPELVTFKKLVDHALNGCPLASYVVDRICDLISEEIVRLTGLLNPNLIVLGGDITYREELLTGRILPGTRRKISSMLKIGFTMPGICFSSFGEYSVAIGATAMILSQILKIQNLKTR